MAGVTNIGASTPWEQARALAVRHNWAAFCLVAYLLFIIVGLNPLAPDYSSVSSDGIYNGEGSIGNQVVSLGLVLMLALATWRRGKWATNLALSPPVLLLMVYCLLTVSWSAVPDIALRRWGQAIISIWVLWRVSRELGYARVLWFVRLTLAIVLVLNYFAVIFLDHGIHRYAFGFDAELVGSWRGILNNKNTAGPVCAFTVIFFLMDRRGSSARKDYAIILSALIFLYFTQSKTSMSGLLVALMAGAAIRHYDPRATYAPLVRTALLFAAALPLVAVLFSARLVEYVDPYAFTGRVPIWKTMIAYSQDHFWTGTGFASFWQVGDASPAFTIGRKWGMASASSGHNGYLEMAATLGYPGLVLALVAMVMLPLHRLLRLEAIPMPCRSLLFTVIIFCVWNNLAESQFIDGRCIDQLFLTIAIALIGLAPLPDGAKTRWPAFSPRGQRSGHS